MSNVDNAAEDLRELSKKCSTTFEFEKHLHQKMEDPADELVRLRMTNAKLREDLDDALESARDNWEFAQERARQTEVVESTNKVVIKVYERQLREASVNFELERFARVAAESGMQRATEEVTFQTKRAEIAEKMLADVTKELRDSQILKVLEK